MKKTLGFRVTGQRIEVTGADILVSGTIDIYTARFTFDSAWDGYTKTAVFAGYDIQREQLLTDDACTVPWEVLTAGKYVKVGVYGTNGGSRLPTIWTDGLLVSPGAGPTEEAAEPSPTLVEQLTAKVGNLDALKTEDKSSLVEAVNEIWDSGGGGGGGGTTDHSKLINRDKEDQHPMSSITGLVDALGGKQPVGSYITEESDPTVPEWAKQPQKPAYTAQEVGAIPSSEKGKADGVATLDSSGKVLSGQIPSLEYAGKTHAANHATGSSDPITPSDIGAASKNFVESYLTIPQNTEDPASYLDNLLDEYIATKPNGSLGFVKIQCQVVHPTLGGGQYIAAVFVIMQDYVSIEAIAYAAGPANNVVRKYTRSKSNGVWGEWTSVNDLISAITTDKVSVADIIDNLTTNAANKPLSAAQGVALKALIDAITIPTALPNPNALTFTGVVTGTYDGSAPVNVEIPSGGGGSVSYGKAKTQILIDQEITELTASLSVTLDHDFHNLTAIINCGSAGAALTADSDGNAVASKIGLLIDTTSFSFNSRKVAFTDTSTGTWKTMMFGAEWSDDLSVFKRGFEAEIVTNTSNKNYVFPFGGGTAMYGTLGTDDNAPRTGKTANIVVNGAYLNVGTRVVLWGEYYE